jgi:hypothetical protein
MESKLPVDLPTYLADQIRRQTRPEHEEYLHKQWTIFRTDPKKWLVAQTKTRFLNPYGIINEEYIIPDDVVYRFFRKVSMIDEKTINKAARQESMLEHLNKMYPNAVFQTGENTMKLLINGEVKASFELDPSDKVSLSCIQCASEELGLLLLMDTVVVQRRIIHISVQQRKLLPSELELFMDLRPVCFALSE